ncbi:MAG TPA: methylenetetrahydrofolate reductase [NAD(P)H] [Polyangia bacterium]|nr:methylenetetrahydrofolate reductase [NAD(P)H] [Polyangia bacterium]
MKISEVFADPRRKVFSFELFPPKTDAGQVALERTIRDLAELQPAYVSVTYGAGGSTRAKTLGLVEWIQREARLCAMAHLTCVGATEAELGAVLDDLVEAGIENVMALRGDPPAGQTKFERTAGGFGYAADLIAFIRKRYGRRICLGGAGYPEGHLECRDIDQDIRHLKAKVDAGLDFVVTQLFFDNRFYFDFVARARAAGIGVPIVPGLMPIRSVAGIERMTKLSGATLPAPLHAELERCRNDEAATLSLGIAQTTAQAVELLHGGAPGIHFYTLNQSPATRMILTALKAARLA